MGLKTLIVICMSTYALGTLQGFLFTRLGNEVRVSQLERKADDARHAYELCAVMKRSGAKK